jgi:hypothetical protein
LSTPAQGPQKSEDPTRGRSQKIQHEAEEANRTWMESLRLCPSRQQRRQQRLSQRVRLQLPCRCAPLWTRACSLWTPELQLRRRQRRHRWRLSLRAPPWPWPPPHWP